MKIAVPITIDIDVNRDVYEEGYYINIKPKSEVNKRIRDRLIENGRINCSMQYH